MRKHRDLKDMPSIVHIQHKQVRNITGILISCSCVSFWLPSPRISFLSPSLPSSNFFVLLVSRGGYTVHTFLCNIRRLISVRLSVHLRICRAVVRFGRQEYNGANGYQLEYGPEIQTVTEEVIKQLHDPVNPLVNTPHPPAQFEQINNVRKQHTHHTSVDSWQHWQRKNSVRSISSLMGILFMSKGKNILVQYIIHQTISRNCKHMYIERTSLQKTFLIASMDREHQEIIMTYLLCGICNERKKGKSTKEN